MTDHAVDRVLEALRQSNLDFRPSTHEDGRWMAQCPAHDDRSPSLSITEGEIGADRKPGALVHCFSGCETASVVAALGLELADLYDGEHRNGNGRHAAQTKRAKQQAEAVRPKTDLGNAERLVAAHLLELRFAPGIGWLAWNGHRWQRDADGAVVRCAKQTVRRMYEEASRLEDADARKDLVAWATRSEAEPRLKAMVSLAESEEPVVVSRAALDAEPYLLTCANGTLDLRTGELRAPAPADLITLGTDIPYDPNAECPRWLQFLEEVFGGDRELVAFLRRFVGYCLTGDVREHVLAVFHGAGANGKSTLVAVLRHLLGDFAVTAAFDTFMRQRDRGPRNDLARLHRARLVTAAESGEGRKLDEATVKEITGGDKIAARFLYGEHFEFEPQFKLVLVTNHRPRVDGDDDAIWRRLRLVPFEQSFEGREDRELTAKLEAELPGILAWAVEGCFAWQRDGLGEAGAVTRATAEYREDEDTLGAFLAERCVMSGETPTRELREAYEAYCADLGERPLAANVLGRRLAKRGVRRGGHNGNREKVYQGVSLR